MSDVGRRPASPKQPLNDDTSDTINVGHSRKWKSVGFIDLEASEARSTKTQKPQAPKTSQPKTDHPRRQRLLSAKARDNMASQQELDDDVPMTDQRDTQSRNRDREFYALQAMFKQMMEKFDTIIKAQAKNDAEITALRRENSELKDIIS